MGVKSKSVNVPWPAFITAILGLVWCAYLAFPSSTAENCLSDGCTVFQNFKIFGLSLWWVGVGFFFILSILCLQGKQIFAWWLARLALAIDAFLLFIMLFFTPCANCLIVAVFLAVCLLLTRPNSTAWVKAPPAPAILLSIWFGLFIANTGLLANSYIPLWSVQKHESAKVEIFFSPTCPSCKKALQAFEDGATFYPVTENTEDIVTIYRLRVLLEQGFKISEALEKSLDKSLILPQPNQLELGVLNILLMRNKVALLERNDGSVPVIQINGMPAAWDNKIFSPSQLQRSPAPSFNQANEPLFFDANDIGSCTQTSETPCPE